MISRFYYSIIILMLCLVCYTNNVRSEIISGTVVLDKYWGWDFSAQSDSCNELCCSLDIMISIIVDPPLGLSVGASCPPAMITMVPDSTFEELKFAPEDTTQYTWILPAEIGTCYVVRTMELHYAKFKFIQLPYDTPIFEYVYQPDGSRILYDTSSTSPSSWGAIKCLFHRRE
jgi:hypothetical protein